MTIRKHRVKDGEVTEVVEEEIRNPWLRLLLGQNGWKLIIVILIFSQHPIGRGILSSLGFDWQDTKKINVATEQTKEAKNELTQISDSVREIRSDVATLKANNAIINEKFDNMKQEFQGFKIDFNKWKPEDKPK